MRKVAKGTTGTPPELSLATAGRWFAASALSFALVGLAVGQPVIMIWGLSVLVGLVWALSSARDVLRRIRKGGLAFRFEEPSPRLRLGVGRALEFPVSLAGPLRAMLIAPSVTLRVSGGVRGEMRPAGDAWVLRLEGQHVGYAWVQGCQVEARVAAGFVCLRFWLPLMVGATVLPRRFQLTYGLELESTRPSEQERAGAGRSRRRGFGLEVRELRDHMPGDSFRHIAWGASARRGRLVTREFESDTMVSAWLMLDVSPSMFWGEPGKARIDFALEAAFSLSTSLCKRGDRVGVLLYDTEVRAALAPARGRGQSTRILEILLESHHLVHEDRTELTERELLESVAQWFESQKQRRFSLPWSASLEAQEAAFLVDDRGLHEAAAEQLERCRQRGRAQRFVIASHEYARGERQAGYRALCRHVGIPLPLDPTPRVGQQGHGFEAAVNFVLTQGKGPHTMIVFSDLHTAEDTAPLRRAALNAKRQRHNMIVLSPADPDFVVEPTELGDSALERALEAVERLRAQHSIQDIETALRPAGVSVVACSPGEATGRVLRHLERVA